MCTLTFWSSNMCVPPVSHSFLHAYSQISETSLSCELTRWCGAGGRDPKPLIRHLYSPPHYNLLPCVPMVHLNPEAADHKDWWKGRTGQSPCFSWVIYLFMEALYSHLKWAGNVTEAQWVTPLPLQARLSLLCWHWELERRTTTFTQVMWVEELQTAKQEGRRYAR